MARFAIFILSFLTLLGFGSWFIHMSLRSFGLLNNPILSRSIAIAMIALPLVLVGSMTIAVKHYSLANAIVYTISSLHLALLSVFVMTVTTGWIAHFIMRAGHVSFTPLTIGIPVFIVSLLLFIVGIITAGMPKVTTQEITSSALSPAWYSKTMVLFADSHFGVVRNERLAKKIVALVNAQNPDAIFVAGDLIDGPDFPYDATLRHFAEFTPSIGTFYTAGNHEEYNEHKAEFVNAVPANVTVLNDTSTVANNTEIVGLTFKMEPRDATLARFSIIKKESSLPTITILHDPKNAPTLAENGSALTFSGHTHGGQFYPFAFAVRAIYGPLTRGLNYFGDGATFTTIGVGTAMSPFRLFVRPEIVVVKIK